MAPDIRVGLVGAGTWGKNYVRNLTALGVLAAVCDQNEQSLVWARAQNPAVQTLASYEQLLEMQGLDAVVVATDTPMHYPVARAALEAGKHVHLEKPMTKDPQQAAELCDIAAAKKLTLMVGHILLYHPAVLLLKKMIDEGELGDIYYLSAIRSNLGQIRRNENAMWSLAPHDISVVQYLFNAEPSHISATGQAFIQPENGVHDITYLTMHFADRRIAHITSSWLDPEKVRLMKIVGSKRMVVFDDMDPRYMLQVHDKSVDWEQFNEPAMGSALKVRTGDIHIPFVKPTEPLKAECEEFLRCIATGATPRSSGLQGYANVKILACADLEAINKMYERLGFERVAQIENHGVLSNVYVVPTDFFQMTQKPDSPVCPSPPPPGGGGQPR